MTWLSGRVPFLLAGGGKPAKACLHCRRRFTYDRPTRRYCSDACRWAFCDAQRAARGSERRCWCGARVVSHRAEQKACSPAHKQRPMLDRREVVRRINAGISRRELAREYGCSYFTVQRTYRKAVAA